MGRYADDNPMCKRCRYRLRVGEAKMWFCNYIPATGNVPGYIGEDHRYHRDTDPCPEFSPKKKWINGSDDWMKMWPMVRAEMRKDFDT